MVIWKIYAVQSWAGPGWARIEIVELLLLWLWFI